MTTTGGETNARARTSADRPDVSVDDRHRISDGDADAAGIGDLWRGPSEARWIARLLRGAPPPRDSAPLPAGIVAHG